LVYLSLLLHLTELKTAISRWQWSALTRLLPEESRLPLLAESAIQSLLPIVYANSQAAYRYVPQPYPHPITLFKAIEQPDALKQDSSLGWHTLTQNIQLHEIPGNHLSFLKKPHVQTLANQLKQYLI
jgi:thioesterase domain-containing protein